ncbi:hypothetical protein H6P81_007333 [Aristolochia fimbriata]|uniref:Uncharacterized protein n=1 Tax=Aristolochia fimbriata TaxID=158543 RepID=A0AAV7F0Z8_ARIFI|nr:hypothetical protein H6P81_007333 [Aristolochia fimbriata]
MEHLLAEPGCLSNGNAAHELPQAMSVEGTVRVSCSNRTVKLPRRKVSAFRNFPRGCGRYAEIICKERSGDNVASDNVSESINVQMETTPSIVTEIVEHLKESELAQSVKPAQDVDLANSLDVLRGDNGNKLDMDQDVDVSSFNPAQDVDLATLSPAQDVALASLNPVKDVNDISLNHPAQDVDLATLSPAQDVALASLNPVKDVNDISLNHPAQDVDPVNPAQDVNPASVTPAQDVDLARLNHAQAVDLANNLDMSQDVDNGSKLDMGQDVGHVNNLDMENCETKEFVEPSQTMSNCHTKDFVEPSKETTANEPLKTSNPETTESLSKLLDLQKNEEPRIPEGPNLDMHEVEKSSSALEQNGIFLTSNLPSPSIRTAVVDTKADHQQKTTSYKRRLSAIRDFPPYCGRHAPQLSKEEYLEFLAKRRKVTADSEKLVGECDFPSDAVKSDILDGNLESKNIVQSVDACRVKIEETSGLEDELHAVPADENELDLSGVRISGTGKSDKGVGCSVVTADESELHLSGVIKAGGGKSAKIVQKSVVAAVDSKLNRSGMMIISREKHDTVERSVATGASKGTFVDGSRNKNNEIVCYQGGEPNLESLSDKVVVLALMAEPNSPWLTEKKISKPKKNVKPLSSTDKGKVKKEKEEHHYSLKWREVDEKPVHLNFMSPDKSVTVIPFGVPSLETKNNEMDENARKKVRETLRLFQVCCRKLLQEEESKSKDQGQTSKRVDLKVSRLLKEKNKWVNTGKQILGTVPGVEVGDEFHYRVELAIVGLHRQYMAGIDYLKENGRHLATSIVASGGYNDEVDNSDVLIYSGHGGQNASGDKIPEDQKLIRGNLALKNSMDAQTPVRVIRGFKEKANDLNQDAKSKIVATYTYDGLYLVEKYWMEKERHGGSVFKFQLKRIAGQPELALRIMTKTKKSSVREGLFSHDISDKKEPISISAVNTIDDERPYPFEYAAMVIYPSWYKPEPPRGCECTNGCSDSESCMCAVKNGGEIPFNHDGAIVEAKTLVYECGPSCKCPSTCHNRVSQRGIKFPLEVFKTESRGWGVRCLTSIPSGSFICEYTGVVLKDTEAEERTSNDEYLFDIGSNYNDYALWDGLSTVIPDLQTNAICEVVETVGFTIDAAEKGNVGRFINHSCSPNLYAQNVLFDHDDKTLPHIMFFAAENIPPLQEITYHYNYTIDQVRDANGNIKKKPCYCGSHECTGRLY